MRRVLHILFFIIIICFSNNVANADEIITISGSNSFKPYIFENSKENPDGLYVDLISKIMENIDAKYKIKLKPWDEARNDFYNNKSDIFLGEIKDRNKKDFEYSIPFLSTHYLIIYKSNKLKKIADFRGNRIMMDLNSDFERDVNPLNLDLQIIKYTTTIEKMIYKLEAGEIDGFVSFDVFFQKYLLDHQLGEDLKSYKVSMLPLDYCVAINKKDSNLLSTINSALIKMKIDGTYDVICDKWLSLNKEKNFTKTMILIILSFFVLIILYYLLNQLILVGKERFDNNLYLKTILNSIPFPVFCAQVKSNNLELWNEAAIGMIGEIENNKISGNLTKECYEELLIIAEKVVITGIQYNSMHRIMLNSGKHFDVLLDVSIIENNGIKYLLFVLTDISEILESRIKAERSDKLKSYFLANMSHEIRTPLNAIVGFSRLLIDTSDKKEKQQYAEIINFNNELLLKMISDVIDLAKVQSQLLVFNDKEIDAVDLLKKIELIYVAKLKGGPVDFVLLNPYERLVSSMDKDKVMQSVTNIINNAIKYTAKGKIEFGVVYRDGVAYIFVKDTGIGISDGNSKKLFGKYEKLDTFAEGTGLGLYLVKSIVEAKGGQMKVVSKEGFGSIFSIVFPCKATYILKENYDMTYVNKIVDQINNGEYLVD